MHVQTYIKSLIAGAFVAALEYSADKEAKIIGKPSKTFFEQSIADFQGVKLEDCIMIGDVSTCTCIDYVVIAVLLGIVFSLLCS